MKIIFKKIFFLFLFFTSIRIFSYEWSLKNNDSYINFSSVKNGNIIEVHKFGKLSGKISQDGIADIKIDLKSINSGIDIRDERLKDFFEVKKYPVAIFSAHIDLSKVTSDLEKNNNVKTILNGNLNLKGHKVPLKIPVEVRYINSNSVQVMSASPVVIDINNFKMFEGLQKLKHLAGLNSIGVNIPVNFKVVFNKK